MPALNIKIDYSIIPYTGYFVLNALSFSSPIIFPLQMFGCLPFQLLQETANFAHFSFIIFNLPFP